VTQPVLQPECSAHRPSCAFLANAAPTMTGEVKRHFRDRTWLLRMPRRLQELRLAMREVRNDFTRQHDRAPTPSKTPSTTSPYVHCWKNYPHANA
jgi:glucokinase